MELGDQLFEFELVDESGSALAPSRAFDNYQALLIIFYSSYCKYSQAYLSRFRKIIQNYRSDSLGILFVNTFKGQDDKDESEEQLLEDAKQSNSFVKLVNDEDLALANAFGTNVTPEAFLFGQQQKLVYRGAIDNAWENSELVTRVYLQDALEYSLDGYAIDHPEIKAFGTPLAAY